ncbi:MAG: HAMP domain-containing sensor histidine kinase [candidate division FCPU426 bacterium]
MGTSIVLLMALAGTLALIYYWNRIQKEAVQMLQTRLNEMELQRFESDKGKQLEEAAQAGAAQLEQVVARVRAQVEAAADTAVLRAPQAKAVERRNKVAAFVKMARAQGGWLGSLLTDETGKVMAWTGKKSPPATIAPTPAFDQASRQRLTLVHFLEQPEGFPWLQITTPCLNERGNFMGVLQVEVSLPTEELKNFSPSGGLMTLIITNNGQRLSPVPQSTFPKNLGALLGMDLRKMETVLDQPAPQHRRAQWENTTYLLGLAATQIPRIRIATLMEISGLEQVVGPNLAGEGALEDPVVLAGLGVIVAICLLMLFWISGSGQKPLKRLNTQLSGMLQTGELPRAISATGRGEWEKLAEWINMLVERVGSQGIPEATGAQSEELIAVQKNLDDLRRKLERAEMEKSGLQQQVSVLETEKSEWQSASQKAMESAESADSLQALMENNRSDAELRIQAITSMSDDLKATLVVIKNYITSILSSEEGKITDTQQEFLGVVINKSARLERQINDLLDISHMEGGLSQLYRSRTELASMIQDVVLNSQPQADIKQVRLVQELHTPLPPLMIDSDRMGQVFLNLVQHAIKTSPVGGEVLITATETYSGVVVKIRDSGPSLESEQAQQVFGIFHGPDSQTRADIVNTGLRFPILKRIVDAHQGTVTMRGLPDQGNEAVITLPKSAEAESATEMPLEVFEVKPAAAATEPAGHQAESEKPAEAEAQPPQDETMPYDLTSFMGKMDEFAGEESTQPAVPGGPELDTLLSDIENIDGKLNR